jgi:hypothetical protein
MIYDLRFTILKTRLWLAAVLALLLAALQVRAAVYDPEITAVVTLTNLTGITNGAWINVNGAQRTWTNNPAVNPTIWIQTTNTLEKSMTNLLKHYQTFAAAGPIATVTNGGSASAFSMIGQPAQSMTVTFSDGWATVIYSTNYLTNSYPVTTPFTVEPLWLRTNQISEIIGWLNTLPSNKVAQAAAAMSDFVNISLQQSVTNKNFWSSTNRGGESTNFHHLRHVMMGGTGKYGTNQGKLYFGTNDGPPWVGYLAPDTNGFLGLFRTNGAAWWIADELGQGIYSDSMLLPWVDLKNIFPSKDVGYYNIANSWNTINSFTSGTNNFIQHLAVYAGLYATGKVAHVDTNRNHYGWVGKFAVLGTNGASPMTNVDVYANLMLATNADVKGGGVSNVLQMASTYLGHQFFGAEGALRFNPKAIATVANGHNKINIGTNNWIYIHGSPSSAWQLGGLTMGGQGNIEGHWAILYFGTGFDVTVRNESGDETTATDRILTLNGTNSISSGNALALAIYDDAQERWLFGWINRGVGTQGGEMNTATNLGAPSGTVQGWFSSKVGVDLQFRSIEAAAGGGITLHSNANTVIISNTMSAASGEANTASNLGSPSGTVQGLFSAKVGVDLRFRSIEAAAGAGLTLHSNANTLVISNAQTRVGVYREVWIPAGAITPATTNGAALGTNTVGADGLTLDVLDFDDTTQEAGWFHISMPDAWDRGTVKAKFFWTTVSGTGGVTWGLAGGAVSDDDTLNASILGTEVEVDDTRLADHDMHVSTATAAITIGGSPALNDWIAFRVRRDPGDGDDTKTGDARLIGVKIQYLELTTEPAAW